MELYSIELTSADVMAHEEVFRREFIDLLGCQHLTVLPPFPDYQLLSRSRAPRPLLKTVNEVVLSRRPTYDQNADWLLVPLALGGKVLAVLLAEGVNPEWRFSERVPVLEHLVRLCLEGLQWEKRATRDGETMLWQRQALVQEMVRAVKAAETGGRIVSRRLLGQGDGPIHFILVCMVTTPAPEPWTGAGPFWAQRGPLMEKSLPPGALAAHLGGGCVAVFWPASDMNEVSTWLKALIQSMGGAGAPPGSWTLHAGICAFPEDFYDVGPVLPWEKGGGHQDRVAAAEEVIRRGMLTAKAARDALKVTVLTYQTLQERGLAPKPEAAAERELTSLLAGDEPGALLLVKLDEWERWQRQQGAREAARRAKEVLKTTRRLCPARAALHWAGPDRFVVFLPGTDEEGAEEHGHALRSRTRSERGTTVSIGLSLFPCVGFSKRDLLDNARKALIHTGFFGPDTQTVFDAVSLNISGDRLFEAGHLEQAVEEFHRALALDSENVNVRNSLGVCYAQMGRIDEAAAEFSRVAALRPDDFMPHYNLGCALVSLGRAQEAEQALKRAADLDPNAPAVWFQLASLCREKDRIEEAVSHLRRTVELRPQWLQPWRLLGTWLLEKGEDEEAMAAFKRALQLNAADAAALSGLAVVFGRREINREVALSLARRSVQTEPANALYLERLARLLFQSGEVEEALTHCQRAAELAPEDGRIRDLLGEIGGAQRASTS
ncbi:MAG TPA: tetratricopeptide repeat protein [Syntrophobacteria bacterium]|nr:tetratricopeptide repeat protein [Syntrophobacteria bacterium]